jgi:hypothetical protein
MGLRAPDVDRKKGVAVGWWAVQALIVGGIAIYLAVMVNWVWILLTAPALWMASKARQAASTKQDKDWGPS